MSLIKYPSIIFIVFTLGICEVNAYSYSTTGISVGTFRNDYNNKGKEQREQVTRYLVGVVDGFIAFDSFTSHKRYYCFPEWVTDKAIYDAVLDHILNNASNFSRVHYATSKFFNSNFRCKSSK